MYDVSGAENDKEMPQNANLDFKMANPSKLAKLLQPIECNENILSTCHFLLPYKWAQQARVFVPGKPLQPSVV